MTLGNERAAWVSGMVVGLVFGLLTMQLASVRGWMAILGILAWLVVLVAYLRIEQQERDSPYREHLDDWPDEAFLERFPQGVATSMVDEALSRDEVEPLDTLFEDSLH